jgi:hypothetical protein
MLMNQKVRNVKEEGNSGEVLEGASRSIDLGPIIQDIAHHYVFTYITMAIVGEIPK